VEVMPLGARDVTVQGGLKPTRDGMRPKQGRSLSESCLSKSGKILSMKSRTSCCHIAEVLRHGERRKAHAHARHREARSSAKQTPR